MPPTPLTPEQQERKAEIRANATRLKRAEEKADAIRTELNRLVLDTLRDGVLGPTDTADSTDWTATYVRALARKNGIQAAERYRKSHPPKTTS